MNRTSFSALAVCAIGVVVSAQAPSTPTFTKDVAPILYEHCTNCHRPAEIGPMSLLTYNDARPWARAIATRVSDRTMPPWHADPAVGEFLNDRRLSDVDQRTLVNWARGGAPEGKPEDLPPLPKYADGWMIGQPDAVLSMQEDYPIPASGTIEYKFFEVPTNFAEDKYVQAIEVRPGTRAVVHHVIVYIRSPEPPKRLTAFSFAPGMNKQPTPEEIQRKRDLNDRPAPRQPGGLLGGFAPGQGARVYQPGTALRVPAGSILTVSMHYTANGTATTDRTSLGFVFAKEKPQRELIVMPLQNQNFTLKAGSPDTRVDAEMTLNEDVTLWSALPHTHLRGKRWEVVTVGPDGSTKTILSVPKYDFNWQTDYVFKEPLQLAKGTRIRTSAWYDNSTGNKANPDPTSDVTWGDQTWDEMQFTSFTFSVDRPAAETVARAQASPQGIAPTFSKDVAPIFFNHCTTCHRPGEIAPMSLLTYADARPWVRSIATRVSAGSMPPWHADPAHGEFLNDRRLSANEKDTILKWINAGAPEGNRNDLPPQPRYADGWMIGQPDVVLAMQEDYPLPANGTVAYQYFEVPTNFTEDKWIQAFEVRPGSRKNVHHVIVYTRDPNAAERPAQPQRREGAPRQQPLVTFADGMDIPAGQTGGPDLPEGQRRPLGPNDRPQPKGITGSIGGYVPGNPARVYEEGTATKLPAGSTLVFQMHYTTTGKPATDRSTIGLIFAKEKPKIELHGAVLANGALHIPAGDPNARVDAEMTINRDVTLHSILPHTHVRGKRWTYEAIYPDGRSETLLSVPNYDFDWQTDYIYKQPVKIPKGTKIHATAWYDNSPGNKSNPDPTKDVWWGDQTWEEMMFTGLTFSVDQAPAASTPNK